MRNNELADLIHVSKQAVSNWYKRNAIPIDKLVNIVEVLDDARFRFVVADYVLNTRLLVKNDFGKDLLSQLIRIKKEEAERQILTEQAEIICAKPVKSWNKSEVDYMLKFSKEFGEEQQAENDFKVALDTALEVR